MKERHKECYRQDAIATLRGLRLDPKQDFHTLRSEQVDAILAEADRVRYQKPKNANGSRARYFYQLLQRRARMAE